MESINTDDRIVKLLLFRQFEFPSDSKVLKMDEIISVSLVLIHVLPEYMRL